MKRVIWILAVLLTGHASSTFASSVRVSPPSLELALGADETVTEQVSLTLIPACIVPVTVDVVASDPQARVTNLSGRSVNGCNGAVSSFDIEFTGTGASQAFELHFVDAGSGRVMGAIPVTITPPVLGLEELMGVVIAQRGIVFQVFSNGCTGKDDFHVEVVESIPLEVRLIRRAPDPCRAVLPLGTRIRFSYEELGIQPEETLRVMNPLATVQVTPRLPR